MRLTCNDINNNIIIRYEVEKRFVSSGCGLAFSSLWNNYNCLDFKANSDVLVAAPAWINLPKIQLQLQKITTVTKFIISMPSKSSFFANRVNYFCVLFSALNLFFEEELLKIRFCIFILKNSPYWQALSTTIMSLFKLG